MRTKRDPTGPAPLRAKETLAAIGTGLYRWDCRSGTVWLDSQAARLIELPPRPLVTQASTVRARLHPEDFIEMNAVVTLALAEGTVAESILRVVSEVGVVIRQVRARLRPIGESWPDQLIGTLHEEHGKGALAPLHAAADDAVTSRPEAEWRHSREAFLLDAGRALAEARSTSEVLRVAASLSMPGFSPDGLVVYEVIGDRLTVLGHHGQADADVQPFFEMPLETDYPAALVVRTGHPVYLASAESYQTRFPAAWPLVRGFGRSSWAFLPLVAAGRAIGAWLAAFTEPVEFTPDQRSVLATIARMLAQALERARVHDSERALSDRMQRSMLLENPPEIPGMTLATRYVPTGGGLQVGGDWYDVIALPNGHTALVIGDVQGHDVPAAGIMGQLRIAMRAYATEGHRPDAVLVRASRYLAGLAAERFATCLYLEVDHTDGTLQIARAGHLNPGVRLGDGTYVVRHVEGGLPLGIMPDDGYPVEQLSLAPGETLLLCTDGLIEAGGRDITNGREQVNRVLATHPADDLEALADAVLDSAHSPGPLADRRQDDIALMLLRREATGVPAAVPARRIVLRVAQAEPNRVSAARANVRATLRGWATTELIDVAELLVSELLTNVLLHTDHDALLTAELAGPLRQRRLRVEVCDQGDLLPRLRHPGPLASAGRGLLLLDKLSDAWGVEPLGEGKRTWFELTELP